MENKEKGKHLLELSVLFLDLHNVLDFLFLVLMAEKLSVATAQLCHLRQDNTKPNKEINAQVFLWLSYIKREN